MTEAADLNTNGHTLAVERHYEAGPPDGLQLVETGDTVAITKEEEWESKKTTEVINTKQIETRVKRQVVLEDGKVVEDSGPVVTTNTTEDTETQQHHQTELKKLGDDEGNEGTKKAVLDKPGEVGLVAVDGGTGDGKEENWVAVPNPDGVVREVKERRVISREEKEDTKEVEDVQHLGDMSDEAYLAAVSSGKSDLRPVLKSLDSGLTVASTGPRLISESHRSKKVTDTEDTNELSSVLPDGRIVTETQRTTEHEEVKEDELPEGAPDQNTHKESHQRLFKAREQEEIEYLADGVKIGQEMRFRGETTEAERRGDGDDINWESLSARAKRRHNQNFQHANRQRLKAVENGVIPSASPLDRKDALTKKPLDFDQEEETRKKETSKWLENHFGSESRSSRDSLDEIEDEPLERKHETKTSFFNVTIKSQPSGEYVATNIHHNQEASALDNQRYYRPSKSPSPSPEYRYNRQVKQHFQGVKEWSERQHESNGYLHHREQQVRTISPNREASPNGYNIQQERYHQRSPPRDYTTIPYREETPPSTLSRKRVQDRPQNLKLRETIREDNVRFENGYVSTSRIEPNREPYEEPVEEPPPDYSPVSPPRAATPGKKHYQKTRFATDHSPPSSAVHVQQTPPPPKAKSGNIIGQSIRKLVGKIRSASAERKAKQQQQRIAKRSPSPTYKQGNVIDNIHDSQHHNGMQNGGSRRSGSPGPVHRYYLGEDPFGGSIYGRENKYDGVKPTRPSRKHEKFSQEHEDYNYRSHSTLGRFSKSSSRAGVTSSTTSQTLPRHLNKHAPQPGNSSTPRLDKNNRSNSTINVSFINTVSTPPPSHSSKTPLANGGPAKPARTYRSNLLRSKSFNVDLDTSSSTPYQYPSSKMNGSVSQHLQPSSGLKSPGLISSISRSQRDLTVDQIDTGNDYRGVSRFGTRNGINSDNKRIFMKDLRQRAPELYNTLHEEEKTENVSSWPNNPVSYSTPSKTLGRPYYKGDIYEPPTRLSKSPQPQMSQSPISGLNNTSRSVIRRGSNSSNDYSETYHTTTRNGDPLRPTITDTVQSFSKKTVPVKNGRGYHTIESTETKSITKSQFKNEYDKPSSNNYHTKYYENDYRINNGTNRGPVIIEVRNNYN